MRVLGIESSCDETAAAVVEDGRRVLADVVATQIAIHKPYGGVVPEIASRHHVLNLVPVLREALAEAGGSLASIDAVAVTRGPGLAGALLCGVQMAKAIAFARGLPLCGVNHLEAHLAAAFLDDGDGRGAPPFPHLAVLVSGGHTALIAATDFGHYRLLGATRDDAAGECFDKVAKMLGLGYPGGIVIERLARDGNPKAVRFPRALPRRDDLDFSFSGLKTSVGNHLARHGRPEGLGLADLCASFQQAVVDVLVRKARVALRQTGLRAIVLAGGVAANGRLREGLREMAAEEGVPLYVPPPRRCTDNAAMVAAAGYHRLVRGERAGLDLNATASLPLDA
ncbi:MAG TPA: tRNA (adenosine(37)-N6)-threonylcarbamoyltransferase complex transferase subunit TsaD [Polyangia bacterium]|jgi:N6-L-threonylcarbamoyladenine synthase